MTIFGVLQLEAIVQENDKTRLDGSASHKTPDEAAISLVRIEPEAAAGFITVSNTDRVLDWEYITDGTKTVSIEITTDAGPDITTATLEVLTQVDDNLFSTDADLLAHEPDILKYAPVGRSSFNFVHRRSQQRLLETLDEMNITQTDGDKLTKANVIVIDDVRDWSIYMSLRFIFEGLSNTPDDTFSNKAKIYESRELKARQRARLRLDFNDDGTQGDHEVKTLYTFGLIRR